jgi:hypothetical protein
MGEARNAYIILLGKPLEKLWSGKPRKFEYNTKTS